MEKRKDKKKKNPIMVNSKDNKKIKKALKDTGSEDENLIRNFIILVVVIAVIIGIVYFATEFVHKKENVYEDEPIKGELDYNAVSVGTILNRPYDEYYVLAFNGDASEAPKYSTMFSMYLGNADDDKYIKAYYLDLSEPINNKYYNVGNDNISNPKAKEIKDLDFGDITLLHIKKGKITEYIEDYKTIQEKLK